MSRLARPSNRNTNNPSSTTNSINNTPAPSNSLSTMARPTRTRTVSTQSAAPTRPSSRLNQIQGASTASSSRTTITRKKSSPAKLINQNELRRTTTESETQDQLQPTQGPLPGANIKVVVRCRGLTDAERAADPQAVLLTGGVRGRELTVDLNSHPSAAAASDQPHARVHDIHSNREEGAGLANTDYSSSLVDDPKRSANIKVYPFDHVFGPEADQALIFTDVVAPILTEVLQGYNCTIFAYGQTGTGKTYTMTGDLSIPTATTIMPTTKADSGPTSPLGLSYDSTPLVIPTSLRKFTNEAGIIPRVLHSLFNMLEDCSEEEKVEFGVKVSFVELYNEELRDLNYLESSANTESNNPPSGSTNLKIFEDSNTKKGATGGSGVYIQNLTETAISSATEGIKILTLGSSRRQIAATKCNEQSSRSHSVFSITIHVKENTKDGKEDQLKIGKLNLVDLAGSENVGRSGAGKEFGRAREAGMINQSLLTLGRVINALVEKNSHVPYRESKLTRLLQDSLGGRTKTCIIATVSPSRLNLDETISTLDYALRAKSIKNRPELNNKINKSILINQYVHEIEKLRHDLIATRTKNGIYFSEERWAELMRDSENKSRTLIESKRKIELIELELIAVKKEFEKCLRILNVRESEIKKIQDELNLRSSDFDTMKGLKEGLELELSGERAMKERFEKSRTKWKNQCKEVYEDNEGLREKIARKAAVESYNQNTLNEVDQSLSSSATNLVNDLKDFANQSTHINKGVKSFLNDMEQRLVKNLELDKFSNIQLILDQVKSDAFNFLESTKDSVQSSFEIIHEKFHQDREKIIKFHELEKAELKEEAARLKEEIERLRQHALEDEKRIQQDEKELIELIQRQHVSNLKRKATQTDLLVQSLAELKDGKDRKRLRFSGLEKELDEDRAQFDLQLNGTLGSANEQLEVYETTFQKGQTSLLDNLSADQRERINAYTAHSSKMETLGNVLDQNCGEFVKEFKKLDAGFQNEVAKIDNQVIGVYHQKLVSQIKDQVRTVEGSVKHVLSDVERQSAMSNNCVGKSLDMVTGLRNDIHLHLTNKIRQDVKTGQTPRRKKLLTESNPLLEHSSTSRFISLEDDSGDSAPKGFESNHRGSSVVTRSSRRMLDRPVRGSRLAENAESRDDEDDETDKHHQDRIESTHEQQECLPLEEPEEEPELVKTSNRTSLKRKNQFKSLATPKSRSGGILRDKANQALR
ncbi:hypothetical protein PtB15_4B636 [Puccinia triticina]|nr:hypothetical protein PtB15_4B636 [Puccinia triticina]